MQVMLTELTNGSCPYLENRTWITQAFRAQRLSGRLYEQLILQGWRRSGEVFYRNACRECSSCIALRVPAAAFSPTKSQRRITRRNRDLSVTVEQPRYTDEAYELYTEYQRRHHGRVQQDPDTAFEEFLCRSPVPSAMMLYRLAGVLVGVGWIDLLPDSISSVYFAFHPDYAARSLGTYSVLREAELAAQYRKRYLHLGFYVPGSPKMAYKARFGPNELLLNGAWQSNSIGTAGAAVDGISRRE